MFSKPSIPTRPTHAEASAPAPSPAPNKPPPVLNKGSRPPARPVPTPSQNPSPPPLETPDLWRDFVPQFGYPAPDHASPGIDLFNTYITYPIHDLHAATICIFEILYPDSAFKPKKVKSPVPLVLRDMDGVAHAANGSSHSGPFKGQSYPNVNHTSELVFSTRYLAGLEHHQDPAFEIRGVFYHELTHSFQYSAENTPGGLIEGIADFVRLRGGFAAKHWREDPVGKKWDQGYETTAYFLDWVDKNIYQGLIALVNEWVGKNQTYNEARLFETVMSGWSW